MRTADASRDEQNVRPFFLGGPLPVAGIVGRVAYAPGVAENAAGDAHRDGTPVTSNVGSTG
jgi:hypothetical protein